MDYKNKYLKYKTKYLNVKNNIILGGKKKLIKRKSKKPVKRKSKKPVKQDNYFDIYINVKYLDQEKNETPWDYNDRNKAYLKDLRKEYEKKYLETEMFYNFNEYFKITKVIDINNYIDPPDCYPRYACYPPRRNMNAFNGIVLIAEWIKRDEKYPINKKFNIGDKNEYEELLINGKDIYTYIDVTDKHDKKRCNTFKNALNKTWYEECLRCMLDSISPKFLMGPWDYECYAGRKRK